MYDHQFEPLNSGEVLFVKDSLQFILNHSTFRTDEFSQALKQQLLEHQIGTMTQEKGGWFSQEGVECEVLRFGSDGWQRGRVRINLEFCPLDTEGLPSQSTNSSQDIDFSSSEESTSPEQVPESYPSNEFEETNATAATAIATGVAATVVTSQLLTDPVPESPEREELGMDFTDVDALEKSTQIEPENLESIESEEADVNPIVSTEFTEESFEEEIGEVTGVAESVIFDKDDLDLSSDSDNDASFDLESEAELNIEEDFNIDDGLTDNGELLESSDDLVIDNSLASETEFAVVEDEELSDDLIIDDNLASEGETELDWDANSNDDINNPEADLDFADAFGDDEEFNPEEISAETPELELDNDSLELEEELDWNGTDANTQLDAEMDWDATSNDDTNTPETDLDFGDDEELNQEEISAETPELELDNDSFEIEEELDWNGTDATTQLDADLDFADAFGDDEELNSEDISAETPELELDNDSLELEEELDWNGTDANTQLDADLDFADAFGDDEELNQEEISAETPELELDNDSFEEELDWNGTVNDSADTPEADLDFADAFGDDGELNSEDISAETPELDLDNDSFEEELDWNGTDANTQLDADMDWDATSNGSADTPEADLDFADAFGDDEDLNLDGVELSLTETATADKEEDFNLDDAFGAEEDFDLASFDNDAEIDLGDSFSDSSDDLDLSKISQISEDFDLDSFSDDEAENNLNQEIVFDDDVWQDISEVKK